MQLLPKAVRTAFGLVTLERLFVYYALQLERIYSGTPTVPGKAAIPAKPASGGNPATPLIPAVPTIPAIPPNAVLGKLSKILAIKEVSLNGTPQSVVSIEIPVSYDTNQWTKSGGDYYSAIKAYENSLAIVPTFAPLPAPTDASTILPDEPTGVITVQRCLGWLAQQLVQHDNPVISGLIEVITNDETTPDPIVIFKVKLPIDWNVWIDTNNLVAAVKPLVITPEAPPIVVAPGFKIVPYTTDGTTKTVSGFGFEPDLLWIKRRDANNLAVVVDSARGVSKVKALADNTREQTKASAVTALSADGFTLGTDVLLNPTTGNWYAAGWDKKAGYLDVVAYTGDGAATRQIAHSLGAVPDFMIVVNRYPEGVNSDWAVGNTIGYGAALTDPQTKHIYVGGNSEPYAAGGNVPWGNAIPTATHFNVGHDAGNYQECTNAPDELYVAYIFKASAGQSAFGVFAGNGSFAGNIIDCGFNPSMVIVSRVSATGDWDMFVKETTPNNPRTLSLDFSGFDKEEAVANLSMNFLDNGFQMAGTSTLTNTTGHQYYYLAFK